jgi:hypothetical protein
VQTEARLKIQANPITQKRSWAKKAWKVETIVEYVIVFNGNKIIWNVLISGFKSWLLFYSE